MSVDQAAAFANRFRGLTGLAGFLKLAKGEDAPLLEVYEFAKKAVAAEGTESKVEAWLIVLRAYALQTKAEDAEDKIVACIETILAGPLRESLVEIVERLIARKAAEPITAAGVAVDLTVEEQNEFRAAGVDAWLAVEVVGLVLGLVGE